MESAASRRVTIRRVGKAAYPRFPYDPPCHYPEFSAFEVRTDRHNEVYAAVRNTLADLRLDADRFGKATWNPLRQLLGPGQRALLKPNWVLHANQADAHEIASLVTHTSVIRAVIDYVILALEGRGTIEIADAPLQNCDFKELVRRNMITELIDEYRRRFPRVTVSAMDLRKTILRYRNGRIPGLDKQSRQSGDPRGYTLIDIAQESLLTDIHYRYRRFRVANYDHQVMAEHHNPDRHEYLIANSVLSADLVINLPKLKCHVKAGITGALKNLVGINGHKEFLPHHVNGCPAVGGDQYPRRSGILALTNRVYDDYWTHVGDRGGARNIAQALTVRVLRKGARVLESASMFDGGWSGNDTIPRTTLDLNNVLYFYEVSQREWATAPVRNVLHIVDGVIAGEGYGPLRPTPKAARVVVAGWNPLLVDICGARLIGYEPMKVRLLYHGMTHAKSRLSISPFSLSDADIVDNGQRKSVNEVRSLKFMIPREWANAVTRH